MRTNSFLVFYGLLVFFLFLINVNGTLSPKSNKGPKNKSDKVKLGPVNYSVIDRNLIVENPSIKDVLNNHQAYSKKTNKRHVKNMVLGYVTPWNNHGYDIAKIFADKFTHISPVWLQVKRKASKNYQITGTHDIDQNWMSEVWKAGDESDVKIVPRVLFDAWHISDFNSLMMNEIEMKSLASVFIKLCKKWGFEGLVLELWSQAGGHIPDKYLIDFIKYLGKAMSNKNLDMILVIPPRRGLANDYFSLEHFNELYNHVTAFSLMTYDFSNPQRPGPNAPIKWMENNILYLSPNVTQRKKILTGLNFYGHAYTPSGGHPIVGHEYLRLIKNFKGRMKYDGISKEHFMDVKHTDDRFLIFYPTLLSINQRIALCNELQTGVSIWELGQGLDYFYDLL